MKVACILCFISSFLCMVQTSEGKVWSGDERAGKFRETGCPKVQSNQGKFTEGWVFCQNGLLHPLLLPSFYTLRNWCLTQSWLLCMQNNHLYLVPSGKSIFFSIWFLHLIFQLAGGLWKWIVEITIAGPLAINPSVFWSMSTWGKSPTLQNDSIVTALKEVPL